MADARKNTLLYHYTAMNVVKRIQHLLKCTAEQKTSNGEISFTPEEIHKVYKARNIFTCTTFSSFHDLIKMNI